MKRKFSKGLGIGLSLALMLALVLAFAVPVAASPAETINEWYKFDYPAPGADGDWFRDSDIGAIGPIAEAINGDLYAAVDITLGYSAGATSTTHVPYKPGGVPVDITVEDGGSAVTWTFDFGVDDDPSTGHMAYALVISNNHCRPAFQIHSNDGICDAWPWGTHLYSPWDPTLGGWHTGDADWNTPVADMDWISASGEMDIADNPEGMFTVSIDKCRLLPEFYWAVYFMAGGFSNYGGLAKYPELWAEWSGDASTFDTATIADCHLMKSTDGGRTWAETEYQDDTGGGPIVDMVCSSIDEDILYVTDGNYVYKSDDGGDSFSFVAKDSLEEAITGTCGVTITCVPITCIDVSYDDDEHPFVFIGTRSTGPGTPSNGEASVLWIGEAGYQTRNWTDLKLLCYGAGYVPYAVGCPPNFADSLETFVVVSNGVETHVVSTVGVTCSWDEVAELVQDCKPANHFGIIAASRIAFPDDWEDTETLFVGVVDDGDAPGGDVYSVTACAALPCYAIDRNVEGIWRGCEGKVAYTNIISLDIFGDTDEASLIAGANDDTNVYCSEDGGWSWDVSDKNPTGAMLTYAIWYEDTALAVTCGCECAVSLCCGEEYPCEFWNQISLISTDIDCVRFIDHSPGYITDSETLFMLTKCDECCTDDGTQSLFRYDQTYWERVYCSTIAGADKEPAFESVLVSPDFNDTNAVFVANTGFEIWRSLDSGCSWKKFTFPCSPRAPIFSAAVIDEDTGITGGKAMVYKTTRHGARPWKEYEVAGAGDIMSFDLEPDYDDPGIIILGDDLSQVFISEDGGEEWELVGDCADVLTGTNNTSVVFDPDYATNDTIYAAAGNVIARCVIDPDEDWADQVWDEIYTSDEDVYWGMVAAGDTALYVTDTAKVKDTTVNGDDVMDNGGVLRSLNPLEEDPDDVVFERLAEGLVVHDTKLHDLFLTCDVSDGRCAENVLWSLDWYTKENVWVYEDTLAAPVVLDLPVDGQKLAKTDEATLSWNELCGADCYEVSLYRYCAECPDEKLTVDISDLMDCHLCDVHEEYECFEDTCIVVDGLEPGTTYYWQVRVCIGEPTLSKWSEERTFTTALLPVPFADLCSPPCGAQDIILTPSFSWGSVEGATGYNVELSTTETFTVGVVKGKTTVNAWVPDVTLEYATTYYWRVRAVKDGVYSGWTYCMFTTMAEPVEAPPPVVVEEVPPGPPPVLEIPPAEMITPNWIYAVIGVGAALAIVVIVLIVRTRRPPA